MGLSPGRLATDLDQFQRIVLDSAILIYHLEDIRPYADLTEVLFGSIAMGKVEALLSTVTVTELLVKPFESGELERVDLCERFLLSLPHARWVGVDYRIAREAARLRAEHRLRTPDAILLATAVAEQAALLSNDRALKRLRPKPVPVLILDDYR